MRQFHPLRVTQISISLHSRKRQSRLKKKKKMISVESSIIDVAQLLHALPRGRWDYCTWLLPFTEVGRGGLEGRMRKRWWKAAARSIYEACTSQRLSRIGGEKGISWNNEIAFLSRGYERNVERNSIKWYLFFFFFRRAWQADSWSNPRLNQVIAFLNFEMSESKRRWIWKFVEMLKIC